MMMPVSVLEVLTVSVAVTVSMLHVSAAFERSAADSESIILADDPAEKRDCAQ